MSGSGRGRSFTGIEKHLSGTFRIARWEVTRSAGGLDRRTALFVLAAFGLVGGAIAAGIGPGLGNVTLDRDVYRVGVEANSPYAEVIAADSSLAAGPPNVAALEAGDVDVVVRDERVVVADSAKGRAALAAFRSATEAYNDRRMSAEADAVAAFPVVVTLSYEDRSLSGGAAGAAGTVGGAGTGNGASATGGSNADTGTGASGDADRGQAVGVSGSEGASTGDGAAGRSGTGGVPAVGAGGISGGQNGSPADIAPPFPFESLVLAFAFLVPMNFVVQLYGSSMLGERTNRRGELLLVSPVSRAEIVAGKTLPYLLGIGGITALIALGVGGGVVSVAAVLPIGLCFLAATFFGAMLARSFKELTFVTVAASVFLTSYVFVPAVFADVTPIALISPLTLVVRDLTRESISMGEYAFSTGPFYLSGLVCFALGAGIYREEDLFTQRPISLKFIDALRARLRSRKSVALLSAAFIPLVFIAELLCTAVLFALPVGYSVSALLLVIATVEELAKSIHVYAGFASGRFESRSPNASAIGHRGENGSRRRWRWRWQTALVLGTLSGIGFFLGEKVTLLAQAVGLPELALGRAAFVPSGAGGVALVALALAPLLLHCVTASIAALGASRSKRAYLLALLVAICVHAAYNFTVVTAVV